MTVLTAANPVAEAIFGLLQDATLQAAVGGRVRDDLEQNEPRPCVLYEIFNEEDVRGLGAGNMPQIDLRTHVFSAIGSLSEAQAINKIIVALLKDASITVTGFQQAGTIVYHETQTLREQELYGVKVHEVVSLFTIWVEQTS